MKRTAYHLKRTTHRLANLLYAANPFALGILAGAIAFAVSIGLWTLA